MIIAGECVTDCSFLDSYLGLLTDAPHVAFELTLEALTGLLVYPIAKRALAAYRDRIHREIDVSHGYEHDHDHDTPGAS